MQDFTNFNQPQPISSDGYYHDPLEAAPAPEAEPAREEPAREESPVLNQGPEPVIEPVQHEDATEPETKADDNKLTPELAEYLLVTKKMLETTRKERNNLIVRIDDEEDKITETIKNYENPDHSEPINYGSLDGLRNELYCKNDLIHALLSVIRSLE